MDRALSRVELIRCITCPCSECKRTHHRMLHTSCLAQASFTSTFGAMLGAALRHRKRWRSGLLKGATGAHPDTDTKETGFSRVQGAADFLQADLHELLNLEDNKWIKTAQAGHLSDLKSSSPTSWQPATLHQGSMKKRRSATTSCHMLFLIPMVV